MREMFLESVAPSLRQAGAGGVVIRRRNIKCFGAGESQIESMLPDLIRRGRTPTVGITASQTTILLRILAQGRSEAECEAQMAPTVATIHHCLGNLVFGEGDDELEHVVLRALAARNETLATVEWGTAGLVAEWLGGVPLSNASWRGGAIVRDAAMAERLLGVPADSTIAQGGTSAEVAQAMAQACRERLGTDWGLAVGAFPEFRPEADHPEMVHIGLASPSSVEVAAFPFTGHPATLKVLTAKRALNLARLRLL